MCIIFIVVRNLNMPEIQISCIISVSRFDVHVIPTVSRRLCYNTLKRSRRTTERQNEYKRLRHTRVAFNVLTGFGQVRLFIQPMSYDG